MCNYKMYGEERVTFYKKKKKEAFKGLKELNCDAGFFYVSFRHRNYILNNDEHLINEVKEITREELLNLIRKEGITRFQFGYVKDEYYEHCHIIDNILKQPKIEKITLIPLYIGFTNSLPPGPKEIHSILNNRKKQMRKRNMQERFKREGLYKALAYYIWTFFIIFLLKICKNMYSDYVLISDGKIHAQDNGECFAKYLESINYKKYLYVLDNKSPDYKKLSKEINVVKAGSIKHLIISVNYKYVFVSYFALENYSFFTYDKFTAISHKVKGKKIFFEHGITYNDHSIYGVHRNNPYVKVDNYVCGAKVEYDALVQKNNLDFVYFGLPRHDYLFNNSTSENKIMIFFTWRRFLNIDCDEKDINQHFDNLNKLLKSNMLKLLHKEDGTKINLFLHKAYFEKSDLIEAPDYINIMDFESGNIQYEIATSKLLVTDYSSVQFEFTFQDKPLINYQFDRERFFAEHYYPLIDIDEMGLTNISNSVDEFDQKLSTSRANNFVLSDDQKKINSNFYGRRDNKNCERIANYYLGDRND